MKLRLIHSDEENQKKSFIIHPKGAKSRGLEYCEIIKNLVAYP